MSDFDGNQLVLQMLNELRSDIKALGEDVTKTREDISALKVKVAAASTFISLLVSGIVGLFVNSKR